MESGEESDREVAAHKKRDKAGKSKSSKREKGTKDRHKSRGDENDDDANEEIFSSKRPSKYDSIASSAHSNKEPLKRDDDVLLWNLATRLFLESQASSTSTSGSDSLTDEKSIIFVGSKDAVRRIQIIGKTTAIFRFLDKDEAPKPTTALEYTFARKPKANNLDKDVANIWELGGGVWLSKLSEIAINPDTIRAMSVAIVVDLSQPGEMWTTLERWLDVLRSRIDTILAELRSSDGTIRERMRRAAFERYGANHQDFDPEKRKVICKTLRFVAHRTGAHLQFFSNKHEALLTKTRVVISHLVFGTPLGKMCQSDHNKPMMITVGQDSFQQIGGPPLPDGDLGRVTAKTPMDLWKSAFTHHFPQENSLNPSLVDDPAKDRQFAEATVDAMRAQKDEELERYRKASERRAKEAEYAAASGSGGHLLKGYAADDPSDPAIAYNVIGQALHKAPDYLLF